MRGFFALLLAVATISIGFAQIPLPGASWRFGYLSGGAVKFSPNNALISFGGAPGFRVLRRDGSVLGDHLSARWLAWRNDSAEYLLIDQSGSVSMRSSTTSGVTRMLNLPANPVFFRWRAWPFRDSNGTFFVFQERDNLTRYRLDGSVLTLVKEYRPLSEFHGFSPDGMYMVYSSLGNSYVVNTQTDGETPLQEFLPVGPVTFSSDSRTLYAVTTTGVVSFSLATGLITFSRSPSDVNTGLATPDGHSYFGESIADRFKVQRRRFSDGALFWETPWRPSPYDVDRFGTVAYSDQSSISLINPDGVTSLLPTVKDRAYEPIISSNGSLILIAGSRGAVELRLASTGQLLRTFGSGTMIVRGFGASPDFSRLVILDDRNRYFAYDAHTGQLLNPGGIETISGLFVVRNAIAGQNPRMYIFDEFGSEDGLEVLVFDLVTFQRVGTILLPNSAPQNALLLMTISADGRRIAMSVHGTNGMRRLYFINTETNTVSQHMDAEPYEYLAFSPSSPSNLLIALGQNDATPYNLVNGTWVAGTKLPWQYKFAAFVPHGRVLALGDGRKIDFRRLPELTPIQTWLNPNPSGYTSLQRSMVANGDRMFIMRDDNMLSAINHPYSILLNNFTAPTVLYGGSAGTGNLFLNRSTNAARVVTLQASNASLTVPASVTIPANSLNQTFTMTAAEVTVPTDVDITATNIVNMTRRVRILPGLSSVSVTPSSVKGGTSSTGRVNFAGNAAAATVVLLGKSVNLVSMPGSVIVPANQTSATFNILTAVVTSNQSVTISGRLGTVTKTAALTITP
jgi:hypothetical protein